MGSSDGYAGRKRRFRGSLSVVGLDHYPAAGGVLAGGLTGQFWLSVVLTSLGYVPGLIRAIYIILTRR